MNNATVNNVVKVGMADINLTSPPHTIRTSGLGSCVGIIIYDEFVKMCSMAHIMLPDSSLAKSGTINRAKYADTAIEDAIKWLVNEGASSYRLKSKIAGGAQMFKFSTQNEVMRVGPRNVEAVKAVLGQNNIPIISEDVGGSSGRTIEFDPSTCMLQIKTVNKGVLEI
ncbi:chemotaxis protein CheD [Bacillus shivajii]|uniref:chemotaxis protein CheD n=1 Tax=Bacillus shivajii TaxID=1983719 RepID=UPI001CFA0A58|nr:chemotaxis protein CheD [Bacillus shivajii]UCZ51703.1 chemotaxis protein CheD [Bacillus shivajii]